MHTRAGELRWRVTAPNGAHLANAFDALILPTGDEAVSLGTHPGRIVGGSVPHEGTVPDTPLTLIVQARAGSPPLLIQCDAIGPDGTRTVFGQARQPLAVIVRTSAGIRVSGLSSSASEQNPSAT